MRWNKTLDSSPNQERYERVLDFYELNKQQTQAYRFTREYLYALNEGQRVKILSRHEAVQIRSLEVRAK